MRILNKIKNITFLIMLIIATSNLILAQKQGKEKLDSLLKELPKAKEDTNKVNILNDISYLYCDRNAVLGFDYGEQALKLAEKLRWKKGMSIANRYLGFNFYESSNTASKLVYYQNSLKLAREINDKILIVHGLRSIGSYYFFNSENSKALDYFDQSRKVCEDINYKFGLGLVMFNYADLYSAEGNPSKAIENYLKALKIFEEANDKELVEFCLERIGNEYFISSHDYNKAMYYFQRALKISNELGNKLATASILKNMAMIYTQRKDYNNSFVSLKRALKLIEDADPKNNMLNSLLEQLARNYMLVFDYNNAQLCFKRALKNAEESQNKHLFIDLLGEIGSAYYYRVVRDDSFKIKSGTLINKNYLLKKAVQNIEEYIQYHHKMGIIHGEMSNLLCLISSYALLGNYKKAYQYYDKYDILKDSIFNSENFKKMAELEADYKVEKKEKENSLLKLEVAKETNNRNLFIILAIFILLLAGGILNRYLFKKRQNLVLEEKNNLLAAANHELDKTYEEKIQFQEQAHENEKQIINLKNEKLESELELKQKELTALAINLVDKNEYLRKLKEQVELIGKANVGDVGALVRMIVRSINFNARSEESWQIFEAQFKVIHRGFMEFIAAEYPDMTVMELKVCALMKINLSSKEICSLLNLSIRTVEYHRLNIRKKMNLDKDINLNQYIALLKFNGINHN